MRASLDGFRAIADVPPGGYEVTLVARDATGKETRQALPELVVVADESLEETAVAAARGAPGVSIVLALGLLGAVALLRRRP